MRLAFLSSLIRLGLVLTHLSWAISLLVDTGRYLEALKEPFFFSIIHLSIFSLLVSKFYLLGAGFSSGLLLWYWKFVKTLAPIAEPQSLGLIGASLLLVSLGISERKPITFLSENLRRHFYLLLLRLALSYPFLEWGADALRNPEAFYRYFRSNTIAFRLVEPLGLQDGVFFLGMFEVTLAILLAFGFVCRWSSVISILTLSAFALVAGYPLALPQNLGIIVCSLPLVIEGGGNISIDGILMKNLPSETNPSS